MTQYDILDARLSRPDLGGPSFTLRNRLVRAAWRVTWFFLASWTPPAMRPWRRAVLRCFGAAMGPGSDVRASATVWLPSNLKLGPRAVIGPRVTCYNVAPVVLGESALVSQGAHLCSASHDIDGPSFQLTASAITIGPRAWVAAEAFVGPGVTIGEGAVLGARAVAVRSIEPWAVAVGNPARPVRNRRRQT